MAGLQRVCAQLLPSDDGVCLPLCIIELGGLLFEKSHTCTVIVRANNLFYTHTDHMEALIHHSRWRIQRTQIQQVLVKSDIT